MTDQVISACNCSCHEKEIDAKIKSIRMNLIEYKELFTDREFKSNILELARMIYDRQGC